AEEQMKGGGFVALRQRLQRVRGDVAMLLRLEEARLRMAAGSKEQGFDYAGADKLYAKAFQWYGAPVTEPDVHEAAERIRASTIRSRLAVALDEWAFIRDKLVDRGGAGLRAVADQAGDDPRGRRLPAAAGRADRAALERLAAEPEAARQPPTNLELLGGALQDASAGVAAERLLRLAQQKYPADFWINFKLASVLTMERSADA